MLKKNKLFQHALKHPGKLYLAKKSVVKLVI